MPIGDYKLMEPFNLQTLKVQEEDIIYLFSDGFVDQMGGPKGKKFMPKRFRQILIDHSTLPLEEQNQKLKEVFAQWKGEKSQMDDVCVFGVKI